MIFLRSPWSLMAGPLRSVECEESVGGLLECELFGLVITDEDVDDRRAVRDRMAEPLRNPAGDGRRDVALKTLQATVRTDLWRDGVGVVMPHLCLGCFQFGDELCDNLLFVHESSLGKQFLPSVRLRSSTRGSDCPDFFGARRERTQHLVGGGNRADGESGGELRLQPRPENQPPLARFMVTALTEDVSTCHFATSSWSGKSVQTIRRQPS